MQETGSPPSDADGEVKLADAWWNVGQAAKGKARGAILLHAGAWYLQAQPKLPAGLVKAKVEKRLEELAALGRDIPTAPGRQPPLAMAPFDEKKARRFQKLWSQHLYVPVVQTNSIGMKLTLIPPGEFDMGSPKELIDEESQMHRDDPRYIGNLSGEGPRRRVRITKPFWLGVSNVTQEEYQRVMGNNPSKFQGDPKRPVEMVSWNDAVEFCRRLSELPGEKAARRRYRLPTEAEWEYACRAGNPGRRHFSAQPNPSPAAVEEKLLGEYAWFNANSGGQTHPVGQKLPNAWGLYDMYGSVWEWCADWHESGYYLHSPTDDPAGPATGTGRANRGGGGDCPAYYCRSASRNVNAPESRWCSTGFRVSMVPVDRPPKGRRPPSRPSTKGPPGGAGPAGPSVSAHQWSKRIPLT